MILIYIFILLLILLILSAVLIGINNLRSLKKGGAGIIINDDNALSYIKDGVLTIPSDVTAIDTERYIDNSDIISIHFVQPSKVNRIASYAFENCANLTDIAIPISVKFIGIKAFQNCPKLKNIILPKIFTNELSFIFDKIMPIITFIEPEPAAYVRPPPAYVRPPPAYVKPPPAAYVEPESKAAYVEPESKAAYVRPEIIVASAHIPTINPMHTEFNATEFSATYFHLVKLTKQSHKQWVEFKKMLERSIPLYDIYDENNNKIGFSAGFNDFLPNKEIPKYHDIFIAYVSRKEHKSTNPPNWQDLECIVTVLARDNIPLYSNKGIFRFPHTFLYHKDRGKMLINNIRHKVPIDSEMQRLALDYPTHKNISMYLFMFIGIYIQEFYADKKIGLLTTPVNVIINLVKKTMNSSLPLPPPYAIQDTNADSDELIFKLYNSNTVFEELKTLTQLEDNMDNMTQTLTKDNLQRICPWYCGAIFDADPETPDCYYGATYIATLIYVPRSNFVTLGSNIFTKLQ
jgi:hypothetical protein